MRGSSAGFQRSRTCHRQPGDKHTALLQLISMAVFDGGGVRGFDPPQEVADPQKVLQNLFGGVDSNPLRAPDSIFLLNQYIYVQLYAAYASIETDVI